MFVSGWFSVFVCVVCDFAVLHALCVPACLWLCYIYTYGKSCLRAVVLCCVMLYGVCFVVL